MIKGKDFEPGCKIDAKICFDEFHRGAKGFLMVSKIQIRDDEGEVQKQIHDEIVGNGVPCGHGK